MIEDYASMPLRCIYIVCKYVHLTTLILCNCVIFNVSTVLYIMITQLIPHPTDHSRGGNSNELLVNCSRQVAHCTYQVNHNIQIEDA